MKLPTWWIALSLLEYLPASAVASVVHESTARRQATLKEDLKRSFGALAPPPPWEARDCVVGQIVKTSSGPVQGHASSVAPAVSEYLGIPYALPATGNRRFAAPVAYVPKNGDPLPGNRYSPDCPFQSFGGSSPAAGSDGSPPNITASEAQMLQILGKLATSIGMANNNTGEDCLSINVWTKPQVGELGKAVMVWFYGGAFQTGTSHADAFNPSKLVDTRDVIVVTFNYRTNIFGFASPPKSTHHNFGFLDQRMAVEWVRNNIAGFGGDPRRITLFGQSAGGASVDAYAYAWTKDPIVNGFIAESSAVGVLLRGDPDAEAKWFNVSKILNCGGPEAANSSLACVRSKPFQDVLKASKVVSTGFIPVVDNVTLFTPSDYASKGASGAFIKRPLLVGANDNEERLYGAGAALSGHPLPSKLKELINNDFSCPGADAARYRVSNRVKAWRYLYVGDWPNLNLSSDQGAFHSAEVSMIFGNTEDLIGIPNTDSQISWSNYMMDMWTLFAKDPDHAWDGLPIYDPSGKTLIQLGLAGGTTQPTMLKSTQFDGGCSPSLTPFDVSIAA